MLHGTLTRPPSVGPEPEAADLLPTERTARLTWLFAHGARLTVAEVVGLTGLSLSGAYALLATMSRVVPIFAADDGRWQTTDGANWGAEP